MKSNEGRFTKKVSQALVALLFFGFGSEIAAQQFEGIIGQYSGTLYSNDYRDVYNIYVGKGSARIIIDKVSGDGNVVVCLLKVANGSSCQNENLVFYMVVSQQKKGEKDVHGLPRSLDGKYKLVVEYYPYAEAEENIQVTEMSYRVTLVAEAQITVSASPPSIEEASGQATLKASTGGVMFKEDVPIALKLAGDAELGPDYTISSTELLIKAGETSAVLLIKAGNTSAEATITAEQDQIVEGDEKIVISATGPGGEAIGTQTVVIVDDDMAQITVSASRFSIEEASGQATLTASTGGVTLQKDVLIALTPAGDAELGLDYTISSTKLLIEAGETSAEATITAEQDQIVEGDERIVISATGPDDGAIGTQTVVIVDDDMAQITVSASRFSIEEASGQATLTASTGGVTLQKDVRIALTPTPAGDAELGLDYTISSTELLIEAGETSAAATITAEQDQIVEGNEQIVISATGPGGEAIGTQTVVIVDDDMAQITVSASRFSIEEASGQATLTASTGGVTLQEDVRIALTLAGDAELGPDYTISSTELLIEAGETSAAATITAEQDQIAEGDEPIVISATGPGGEAIGTQTVVIVDDDMAGVTVVPVALSIEEGGSGTYTVVLTSAPPGTVTIEPRSVNTDVTFTPEKLEFTAGNWDAPQTVVVNAVQDADASDESATITHVVSGYGDVTSADSVTVNVSDSATVPGAPRNLTATSGDGEVMLTWSPPLSDGGTPIVRYEYQVDGRAWSETDGPTRHVVDDLTNGTQYTFGVRAINSVNEESPGMESTSASVAATPEISPQEKEAVSETVRAVTAATAANIAANIGTRFAAARSGSTVVVGGQPVNFGPVSSSAFISAAAERDRGPFDEFSSASHGRSVGVDDLLRSSAFEISLNAADDEAQGAGMAPQWTIWGRGDLQFFESLPERGSTYDGSLKAGYLGIDGRSSDQWLFGLAASLTNTEADYGLGDGSGGEGRLDVSITGLHPYLRYSPDDTNEFWAILGLGQGEITNERAGSAEREASDIDMRMAAAGARRNLVSDREWNLALLGDVGIAQIETEDGVQAIQGLSVDTWRGRLGVEGSHTALLDSGYSVTTFAEVAGRYDGGGDEDEVGLELSPGVYVAGPNGLGFEVRGRMLALHTAENYEEYGASMTLSVSPRPDGSGLSLSIAPRVGGETEGADTLWREDPFALSGARSAKRDAPSLDVGVGYGIRAMNGLLTPFGEFNLSNEDRRRLRAGTRFNLKRSSFGELSLELAGERHESDGSDPEHRVGVIGRLRF